MCCAYAHPWDVWARRQSQVGRPPARVLVRDAPPLCSKADFWALKLPNPGSWPGPCGCASREGTGKGCGCLPNATRVPAAETLSCLRDALEIMSGRNFPSALLVLWVGSLTRQGERAHISLTFMCTSESSGGKSRRLGSSDIVLQKERVMGCGKEI